MKLCLLYVVNDHMYNIVYLDFLHILLFLNIKKCMLENGLLKSSLSLGIGLLLLFI